MMDNGLKRLNRKELLEMLIEQGREIERLKKELQQVSEALYNKEIKIQNAGTMAEAAFSLQSVCENADAAAQQYLENIRLLNEQAQTEREHIIQEAHEEAAAIVAKAEFVRRDKLQEVNDYVRTVNRKVREFYQTHPEAKAYVNEKSEATSYETSKHG